MGAIPFAAAKDVHVSPVWAWAYLAHGDAMPDCVGRETGFVMLVGTTASMVDMMVVMIVDMMVGTTVDMTIVVGAESTPLAIKASLLPTQ